jgi:hypothetical protein
MVTARALGMRLRIRLAAGVPLAVAVEDRAAFVVEVVKRRRI